MNDTNIIITCMMILFIVGGVSYLAIAFNDLFTDNYYSTINQQNKVEYTYLEDDQIISKINDEPVIEYKGLTDYYTKSGWYTTDINGNIVNMSDE
ncbi:hypothetical protein [Methanosphaera sp.]